MFSNTGNNFVSSDNNHTDVATKSTCNHYTPESSLATYQTDDASTKSEQHYSLEPIIEPNIDSNIDPNHNVQNFDPNYDQSIEHLVDLVEKYESQLGDYDEQSYNSQAFDQYSGPHYTENVYQCDQSYSQTPQVNSASFNDLATKNVKLDLDGLELKGSLDMTEKLNGELEINEQLDVKLSTNLPLQQPETEKRIPRPPNAFMIFGQQNRKLLANQFPQYTNKQISKILGDEWRKMKLEDKAHFHRLAEDAYSKHMKKYPGYYYSPLEARQRKADRKKKFFQKVNSKRSYVRQQQQSSTATLETEEASSVQLINFRNVTTSDAINEIDAQVKILKQQATDEQQNAKMSATTEQSINNQSTIDQVNGESNFQMIQNFSNTNSNLKSKYESQTNQYDQLNRFQQQPNRLFCSHGVMQNNNRNNGNIARHLFNNQNATNEANNASAPFYNINHQSNGPVYHYHHPTIYHVTTKDPNLNSTLNSTLTDAGLANVSFNNNMNPVSNGLTNTGLNNFNSNFCNPANQLILTNQLLLQHQQLYHQQLSQQNDANTLSVFLPQIEPNNNHSSFQQYAQQAPVVGQQQFAFDVMTETERQQNNYFINSQQTNKLFSRN